MIRTAAILALLPQLPTDLPGPAPSGLELRPGDRICLVGNALAERMQHAGWLEARLQGRFPALGLSFRNLGFSGDEVDERRRTAGFGTPDEWLDRCDATVVLAFFGFVESFDGPEGVPAFERALSAWAAGVRATDYSGDGPPRLVLFSATPFEDTGDRNLPDALDQNLRIALYNGAIESVAGRLGVPYVDLYSPLREAFAAADRPLSIDGIHLNDLGQRALAEVIEAGLFGPAEPEPDRDEERLEAIRQEVLVRNRWWFDRYRVTDGYNVYGGRSALRYTESIVSSGGGQDYSDGLSNLEVLQREMEILDVMCANADRRIQAVARGEDPDTASTVALPEPIPVPTNRPGPHRFLSGEEALGRMTPAEGVEVRLFAGEERFPELANPVQMAWDPRGRLWVATWPTYPHWQPGRPMNDKLVVLEDLDADGRADRSTVFAEDLHNPTGFEHWNGGVLVASCPDILFLQDTDGDGRADRRERILHGLSSADTHHSANSFVFGPEGALYFQEGTFHQSQIETIHGVVRNDGGCVWRLDPRTWRVERYVPYGFANPHGHVFDAWGQDFVTDGTGNVNYYALPFSGHLEPLASHAPYFPLFQQRSRPAAATEILSSRAFPDDHQGSYLVANVIGFQGIFQYRLEDAGSGFGAVELEPLVHGSDPNFRPVDVEVGPDGAVYFLDWHNPLIGHMQHHLRDPSRDAVHGRVYRASWAGALRTAPVEPLEIGGRPVEELVALLAEPEDRVRYRTRLELSARDPRKVVEAARAWAATRAPGAAGAHERLEALWVQTWHGAVDRELLEQLLESEEPRARAAATRVVRHERHRIEDALELLAARIDDEHPRVRLEALVGCSFFAGPETGRRAAELALRVLEHPTDAFLDYALEETLRPLEAAWRAALLEDPDFATDRGALHLLARLPVEDLRRVRRGELVPRAILARHGLGASDYATAVRTLAEAAGERPFEVWRRAVEEVDDPTDDPDGQHAASSGSEHAGHLLAGLFAALGELDDDELGPDALHRLRELSRSGHQLTTRRRALAELVSRRGVYAGLAAENEPLAAPIELFEAAAWIAGDARREVLELALEAAGRPDGGQAGRQVRALPVARYVRVELPGRERTLTLAEVVVLSDGVDVAAHGTATQSSTAWGGEAARAIDGDRSGAWTDGGQTHTAENRRDPWWELDLGAELSIESVELWNRTDGALGRRLDGDGFRLLLLDAERRVVRELGSPPGRHLDRHRLVLDGGARELRRAALHALAALHLEPERSAAALVTALDEQGLHATAVEALRVLGPAAMGAEVRARLADRLRERFAGADEESFGTDEDRELLALADELAPLLPADEAAALQSARRRLGPRVVVVRPVRDAMLYDLTAFEVVAGRPVELVFENVDIMPHNLLVAAPGSLARVGQAAEAMASEPDAYERAFVPDTGEVLVASRLLQPGERQTLTFEAPETPGEYPYVCTFPGHWVRMNGVMTVVPSWDDLSAEATDGERPAHSSAQGTETAAPARTFVRSWTPSDFQGALETLGSADPDRGRQLAEEASCLRCHTAGGSGGTTGPALEEAVARLETPEALLAHLLDPSLEIRAGYDSEIFLTTDGRVLSGRVVTEEPDLLLVQNDPYRDDLLELPLEEVEERRLSTVSTMPAGLLSTFERDEVLALLAWLRSLAP